jgi:DNA-directed RNA polymerase subunit RPC12/RpoP
MSQIITPDEIKRLIARGCIIVPQDPKKMTRNQAICEFRRLYKPRKNDPPTLAARRYKADYLRWYRMTHLEALRAYKRDWMRRQRAAFYAAGLTSNGKERKKHANHNRH